MLRCCFCPVLDGYLKMIPTSPPAFAHIGCSLLSPGGNITAFAKLNVTSPGSSVKYCGECMVNPRQVGVLAPCDS